MQKLSAERAMYQAALKGWSRRMRALERCNIVSVSWGAISFVFFSGQNLDDEGVFVWPLFCFLRYDSVVTDAEGYVDHSLVI